MILKTSNHKIKQPKNLQKLLHLQYYIASHYNKFHQQIVNILLVVESQNNFEFQVSNFIKKHIDDSNKKKSNDMDRI